MNKKSWCIVGMIAVFIAVSILVAEFTWPYLTIIGFIVYTLLAWGVCVGAEEELTMEYKDIVDSLKDSTDAAVQKAQLYYDELEDVTNELDELKAKYKDLEDLRKLNEQPKPKKTKKKVVKE